MPFSHRVIIVILTESCTIYVDIIPVSSSAKGGEGKGEGTDARYEQNNG